MEEKQIILSYKKIDFFALFFYRLCVILSQYFKKYKKIIFLTELG